MVQVCKATCNTCFSRALGNFKRAATMHVLVHAGLMLQPSEVPEPCEQFTSIQSPKIVRWGVASLTLHVQKAAWLLPLEDCSWRSVICGLTIDDVVIEALANCAIDCQPITSFCQLSRHLHCSTQRSLACACRHGYRQCPGSQCYLQGVVKASHF